MSQNHRHRLRIRGFQYEDAQKVSYLIRKALTDVNSRDYPQDVIQFMVESYSPRRIIEKSSNRLTYVAVDYDQILGTVSLEDNIISALFVNPRFHRRGIGTKLMMHVESVTRKRGHRSVRLGSSITAYEFYKKRGYIAIGEEYSEKLGKFIMMEKDL